MSVASAARKGKVRSARKMPPMPSVSAMVWRSPYFAGTVKSVRVASIPPICTVLMTKSTPSRASRRFGRARTVIDASS